MRPGLFLHKPVYYARLSNNEIYECKIREITEEYVVLIDSKTQIAYLVGDEVVDHTIFETRKDALDEIKRRRRHV